MDMHTQYALTKTDRLADYFDTLACDLARSGMECTAADLAQAAAVIRHLAVRHLTQPGNLVALLEADPADVLAMAQERCPGEAVG